MNYTDILRQLLQQQYPEPEDTKTIVISTILLRIIPTPAKPLFLQYQQLQNLIITKCDLRNLENFPKLKTLKNLDISENSLQGSLNNLMPLGNLTYLNLANNLINDFRKLQPLQMIDSLEVYLIGNPFIDGEVWKSKVKSYGIKVLKEPKVLETKSEVKQEEKKEEKKIVSSPRVKEPPSMQANNQTLIQRRNSFLFQIRARRRRMEQQQQKNQNRNGILQLESDSNSIIQPVEINEHILEAPFPQYSSSDENQENQDHEEEENHNEDYVSEEIEPFFDVFLNQGPDVEDEQEEQNDNLELSESSES